MIFTVLFLLFCWNLFVLLLYGADKLFAIKATRRISEKCLLFCAFLMGGFGAFFGMQLFRHKTKTMKFNILIPIFCVLQTLVLALAYQFL